MKRMKWYRIERWMLCVCLLGGNAQADPPASRPAAASGASGTSHRGCPGVKQGASTFPYDCLNRKLAPRPVARAASSAGNPAEGLVTQPPNRTGAPPVR